MSGLPRELIPVNKMTRTSCRLRKIKNRMTAVQQFRRNVVREGGFNFVYEVSDEDAFAIGLDSDSPLTQFLAPCHSLESGTHGLSG